MFKVKHTALILVLFFSVHLTATEFPDKYRHKPKGHGYRIGFGTGLSFYHLNDKHADSPKQKMNGIFGVRRELRVSRDYKTYVLFGADYVFHGISYQSYYFKPDSIKLYDKKFNYNYSLFMNEIHIPFQMKYLLRREDNSLFSPYILVGYNLRFLLPGILNVRQDGKSLQKDNPDMQFRTFLIHRNVNASISASAGWQKNRLGSSRGSFFAEINFLYGFSDFFFESDYSATSMFINGTQVTLLVGAKF